MLSPLMSYDIEGTDEKLVLYYDAQEWEKSVGMVAPQLLAKDDHVAGKLLLPVVLRQQKLEEVKPYEPAPYELPVPSTPVRRSPRIVEPVKPRAATRHKGHSGQGGSTNTGATRRTPRHGNG